MVSKENKMIKEVLIEPIRLGEEFRTTPLLTKEEVEAALNLALQQLELNLDYFGEDFPTPATFDNIYPKMDNTEWTNGFWTGALWLGYEYSASAKMKALATSDTASFF